MRVYRWSWGACWLPVAAIGAAAGVALGSPAPVVAATLLGAVLTGFVTAVFVQHDRGRRIPVSRGRLVVTRSALRAAVATGLLVAWSQAVGPLLWPMLLLAVLTSPAVIGAGLRCARGPEQEHTPVAPAACTCGCAGPVSAREMADLVEKLDDTQLRRAWRTSHARLRAARTQEEWSELVQLRAAYLTELDRRDADGVRSWLATAPRPDSTPESLPRPGRGIPLDPPAVA